MPSTDGKKSDSSEACPSTPQDSDISTTNTPTTDLLPLLSEAYTARVESEFDDVPEVIVDIPPSPPQKSFVGMNMPDDTLPDVTEPVERSATPPVPVPMLYGEGPVVVEVEEILPELTVPELPTPIPVPSPPIEAVPDWLDMVAEVVDLIAEMEEDAGQLTVDQPDSAETCRHVALRLTLMLARNSVTIIGIKEQGAVETIIGETFDRARHQPVTSDMPLKGAHIVEVISPGFAVGQRIFRRARVRCQ